MHLQYVDMLGTLWQGTFYTAPRLSQPPYVVLQARAEHFGNIFASGIEVGDVLSGGYNAPSGQINISASSIWVPDNGVRHNGTPWGYCRYYVLAAP